ncbi:hypothetical protein P7K49_005694 [Saguinus oedipus]|uniref:Uncharacterized protein n=1 Tax=Saguinus oedipus TaxID=9490 RepID=A0ABQ9W098_SAGOE|nr:hypothetical protein P7K49_005694 [Saguinus oedipus]
MKEHSEGIIEPPRFSTTQLTKDSGEYCIQMYRNIKGPDIFRDRPQANDGGVQNVEVVMGIRGNAENDSLSELCENEHDNVVLAFKQLSQTFYEKLEEITHTNTMENFHV